MMMIIMMAVIVISAIMLMPAPSLPQTPRHNSPQTRQRVHRNNQRLQPPAASSTRGHAAACNERGQQTAASDATPTPACVGAQAYMQ